LLLIEALAMALAGTIMMKDFFVQEYVAAKAQQATVL
jgi:hypothetical protein